MKLELSYNVSDADENQCTLLVLTLEISST